MGYPSICGAGNNACVLHYTSNRKISDSTELILVDMGAEYHGYTADITRTIPVNGRFSPEQAVLYNIVLEAQNAGIAACTPGADFRASHRAAEKVIARKLKELGIIQQEKDVDTYFMHGTSHYLGLDVHDAGTYGALKEGVVLTVEPGIYIPEGAACDKKWWGIGIRIEDDILVTSSRPMVMTRALPRTIAELESLMQQD
jgi:Xaa-Pro aminopeptidase